MISDVQKQMFDVTSRTILSVSFLLLETQAALQGHFYLDATTDVLIIHISSHYKQNTIMFGLFSNSDAKKAELISLGLPEEAA